MTDTHPLRQYRESRGLTEDALAAELGVAGLTIKRWEAGAVLPQGRWRSKIKDATGVTFSQFVAFAEQSSEAA